MVPLNWRLSDHELAGLAGLCSPTALLYDAAMAGRAAGILAGTGKPGIGWGCSDGSADYEDSLKHADPVRARDGASPDEVTHILYTSGTTGQPKGALTTPRGMLAQAINTAHTRAVAESGCHHLNPMPVFHAGGLHALANPVLYFGGQVAVLAGFVPEQVLRVMSEFRVTHFNMIPASFAAMSDLPGFDELDLSAVRLAVIAGAVARACPARALAQQGHRHAAQYGATETGLAVTALMPPDDLTRAQTDTAGQSVPDVEICLVDEARRDVPDGTAGEIWLRGPAITPGYWQADRSDYFTGRWFRTGDVARRDERGHYHVVGRTKEMYKSGGENVYPA
jgi:fatty-acyl-CoA synthase